MRSKNLLKAPAQLWFFHRAHHVAHALLRAASRLVSTLGPGRPSAAARASGAITEPRPQGSGFLTSRRFTKAAAGFTLVELIVAFTILLALSAMSVPAARYQVRRQREKELREALYEMRHAIDKYKDMVDAQKIKMENDTFGYPKTLQVLVDGVPMQGQISGAGESGKIRFLRRIPKDPMTGSTDWGMRSVQDEPSSSGWGGQDVFDVFTKSTEKGTDGTPYSEW